MKKKRKLNRPGKLILYYCYNAIYECMHDPGFENIFHLHIFTTIFADIYKSVKVTMAVKEAPSYRRLYEKLRRLMEDGTYQRGDLLPSENELCAAHHLTPREDPVEPPFEAEPSGSIDEPSLHRPRVEREAQSHEDGDEREGHHVGAEGRQPHVEQRCRGEHDQRQVGVLHLPGDLGVDLRELLRVGRCEELVALGEEGAQPLHRALDARRPSGRTPGFLRPSRSPEASATPAPTRAAATAAA